MTMNAAGAIREALAEGLVIPYFGPGVLKLCGEACPLPAAPEVLVDRLTARASVPHKIRKQLTAAAQFIENFKHRTLRPRCGKLLAPPCRQRVCTASLLPRLR